MLIPMSLHSAQIRYQNPCKINKKSSWQRGGVAGAFWEGTGRQKSRKNPKKVKTYRPILGPSSVKKRTNVAQNNIQKTNPNKYGVSIPGGSQNYDEME
jgi:hypothetical protein